MSTYVKTSSPHIHDSESVPKIFWKTTLALFPLLIGSIVLFGWHAFLAISVSIVAAACASALAAAVFRKKWSFYQGADVLIAVLLVLMLPPSLPLWMVGSGVFIAILVGKEIFGGIGSYPFSPSHLGRVILQVSFPAIMYQYAERIGQERAPAYAHVVKDFAAPYLPEGFLYFLGHHGETLGEASAAAVIMGGIILVWQRLVHWEVPLLHFGTTLLLIPFLKGDFFVHALSGGIFLTAFFMIADPVTTPLMRAGSRVFAVGTAVIAAVLWRSMSYFVAVSFAILIMNVFTPWLDLWLRPKGSRVKQSVKRNKEYAHLNFEDF